MTRTWSLVLISGLIGTAACARQSSEPPAPAAETPAAVEQPPPAAAPVEAPAPAPAPQSAAPSAPRPAARPAARPAPASSPAAQPAAPLSNTAETRPTPAPAAPKPTAREVTIAAGTELPLELLGGLTSETAAVDQEVRARLKQAIVVDGLTVIPNGATVTGVVTEVARAGRVQGRSRLALRFTQVSFSGEREAIRTNPLTFEGEATKSEDATKVGAGAGIGAVIGGIVGGGSGAAKGAVIGGAAGAGTVLATRGREVELASGAAMTATLAAPVTFVVQLK